MNSKMTVGRLQRLLMQYPANAFVEIRLVLGDDIYISEPASLIPARDHKGRLIVQVSNES